MMHKQFKLKPIVLSVFIALNSAQALALEPYPANPPTLSTSTTPNIMLFFDNSGSMGSPPQSGGATKLQSAKTVTKNLLDANPTLRWGLFTFDSNNNETSGVLVQKVGTPIANIKTSIDAITAATWTPLGETFLEITQYFQGKASLYDKDTDPSLANKQTTYTSPIQYRCQKNFTIIMTDGDSTKDNKLPGNKKSGGGTAASQNLISPSPSYIIYDSNNAVINKSFNICTKTDVPNGCPASLESYATTPGFGDETNRFRSVRDVARYANLMDMKPNKNENDGDGKSYNDPKFITQNMQTYTVGFDVDNETLRAAAIIGGGTYNTALTESQLTASLNAAISSINASVSNAGGVAVQSEITVADNKVFQPVFNPNGWYGELRRYDLDALGNINLASKLDANQVLNSRTVARKIYTAKTTGDTTNSTTKFDFDTGNRTSNMTTSQKTNLGASTTEQDKVISFIRNDPGYPNNTEKNYGYRVRANKLGDIIDGQPVVVAKPAGYTSDSTYTNYQTSQKDRKLVFVGANDGMFHSFTSDDMVENYAFIPEAVYPHLSALKESNYGQGTPHTFHVNGAARQLDVKFGTAWNTIIAGGLGQGGQGYFAINATNMPATVAPTAANTVMWEFNDKNDKSLGYSFSNPIIYNVRTGADTVTPAVIFSNGYNNGYDDTAVGGQKESSNTSALYIVNALNGNLIKKITLDSSSTGLSSPAGVDFGQDGVLDYVYAGDENGNLWRFDLTKSGDFKVATNPIFKATNTADGVTKQQPITMRPAIMEIDSKTDSSSLGNLVIFGTGRLLTEGDRTNTETQALYAVLDTLADNPTTILKSELQQQSVVDTATESGAGRAAGTYRKVSKNEINTDTASSNFGKPNSTFDLTNSSATKKGWYLNLPTSTEKLVSSPLLLEDKVIFGTGITTADGVCIPNGSGWIMSLNPLTGSINQDRRQRDFSFIDINKNSKSDTGDKITFTTGSEYMSGFQMSGIPTESTFVQSALKLTKPNIADGGLGSAGSVIALKEANSMAVYTGNAKTGTTSGIPMDRPTSGSKGQLITGTIGSDKLESIKIQGPVYGVKIETSTWREIK